MGVIWPVTLAIGEVWVDGLIRLYRGGGFERPVNLAILGLRVIRIREWRDGLFHPWKMV